MNLKIKISTILIILPILFGCISMPNPVYKLKATSIDKDGFWVNGREYHNLRNENIEMDISFDEVKRDLLSFDVIITNIRDENITIDQDIIKAAFDIREAIYEEKYNGYTQKKVKVETGEFKEYVFIDEAIDPETVILDLEKEIKQTESLYESIKSSNSAANLLDAIVDIATIGSKTSEELEEDRLKDKRRRENNMRTEQKYEKEIINLRNDKELWENQSIRKNTLKPEDSIRGKIYFEIPENINKFITINLSDNSDSIDYGVISY